MKVAVTSTVVLDIPNADDVDAIKRALYAANIYAIGIPQYLETVTGVLYTLHAIERFEVERRG